MQKHTYTRELAPLNTGSITRPARFNLRLTCSDRARTLKVFSETRELLGMPKDYSFADVWSHGLLRLAERAVWHLKESPTAMKELIKTLYTDLPKEDWVRNRYAALKERLEPKPKTEGSGGTPTPRQTDLFDTPDDDD